MVIVKALIANFIINAGILNSPAIASIIFPIKLNEYEFTLSIHNIYSSNYSL